MTFASLATRRIALLSPSRTAGANALLPATTTVGEAAEVWAIFRPKRGSQVLAAGATVEQGPATFTVRRPVDVAGVEVVPDSGWHVTMTDAGRTRSFDVQHVEDGDPDLPTTATWLLHCVEVRHPA